MQGFEVGIRSSEVDAEILRDFSKLEHHSSHGVGYLVSWDL